MCGIFGGIAQLARAIGSYPIGHGFKSNSRYQFNISPQQRWVWPVGQAVKTRPFHGCNMGSIPVRVTKKGIGVLMHPYSFFACSARGIGTHQLGFAELKVQIPKIFEDSMSEKSLAEHIFLLCSSISSAFLRAPHGESNSYTKFVLEFGKSSDSQNFWGFDVRKIFSGAIFYFVHKHLLLFFGHPYGREKSYNSNLQANLI